MGLSTEATIALLTLGTVLPVGSLLILRYCRNRQQRQADEARPATGGLIYPPGNSDGGGQGSWASLNMRSSNGGISIRIGLDESRLELLQDRTTNNKRLAGASNPIEPSSGSELHELESLERRHELA